jgi:hypothetical protein
MESPDCITRSAGSFVLLIAVIYMRVVMLAEKDDELGGWRV